MLCVWRIYPEHVYLASISSALACEAVGVVCIEDQYARSVHGCLALTLNENTVAVYNEVVPLVVTEGDEYSTAATYEIREHDGFGCLTLRF